MEKEKSKILVRDVLTKATLFECSLSESEKAYQFAAEMEELGLDIEVIAPTLTDTLSNSLGLSAEQKATYQQSMKEEIEQHDGSCCFEDNTNKKIH